jgi:hypothetical protein
MAKTPASEMLLAIVSTIFGAANPGGEGISGSVFLAVLPSMFNIAHVQLSATCVCISGSARSLEQGKCNQDRWEDIRQRESDGTHSVQNLKQRT